MPKRKKLYLKRLFVRAILNLLELDERLRLSEVARGLPRFERRQALRAHWIGGRRRAPQPEGPFPELAARSLVLIISGCVTWVTGWALYFAFQGWNEGLIMVPLFVAWVLFVLFFRGVKLRLNGVVQ